MTAATRPWLKTFSGVRIDQSDLLWALYETVRDGEDQSEVALAKAQLYELAGSGDWDDCCEHCPRLRYEHRGAGHAFISEVQ